MNRDQNSTKYSCIYHEIRAQIVSGAIRPGERLASENELCKQYDVSRYTVRRAISQLAAQGLVQARHGQGTFCTNRGPGVSRSHNIAVITTYLSDYIFPSVIRGIDRVMSENGYTMFLKNTGNSQKNEAKCLEEMMKKDIDGLIIEPSRSEVLCRHEEQYRLLDALGLPYVFIQGQYLQMKDKPCVLLDERRGGYLATKYLLDTGHRNIAGIFKMDDFQGCERHKGYVQALNAYKMMYNPDYVISFHTEDRRTKPAAAVSQLFMAQTAKEMSPIDGIVCYNDQTAVSVIESLKAQGYKVPQDVSVVGYDNSQVAKNGPVKLTSVNHPKEQLGEYAARLLLDMIDGHLDEKNSQMIMEPELVIRESCMKRQD